MGYYLDYRKVELGVTWVDTMPVLSPMPIYYIITLISPSMTGLRKMSNICEQYASEYDILFNGRKSKLLFFKARCCNVSTLSIVACGQ